MQVWSTIKTILANKNTPKKGFTLVEILVVIVILGILSTLGAISVTKIISASKEKVFANEAKAFINAAKTKSAETIVPSEGLCYSISDLEEYIEKDISDYTGSVFVSGDNKYKIWVSKGSNIVNNGTIDDINVVTVDGEIDASSICPSSFIPIVVNASGGTFSGDLQSSGYIGQQVDLTNVKNPVKAGYNFTGWTVSGTGSNITNNILTVGSEATTIIANWTANSYTLTVNAAGGTYSGTTPITVTYGQTTTVNAPVKANYTFSGWTVVGVGSSIVGTTFTMGTENATLIANWTLSTFTLTVDANGGTWGGTTPQSLTYNQTATIANPSRSGYIFTSWTVSGTGSTLVGTTFTMGTANATLTANWLSYASMYTYNGTSTVLDDGSGNWRIKLTTAGTTTFTPLINMTIDVFLVGGGGAGGVSASSGVKSGGGGGAGGYTGTYYSISLTANTPYTIVIGAGGIHSTAASGYGGTGGTTSAFGYSKAGGTGGYGYMGDANNHAGGTGGSNGGTGRCGTGYAGNSYGSAAQGSTTCEFEAGTTTACTNGTSYAYAGGGGGGGGNGGGGGAAGIAGAGAGAGVGGCNGGAGTANTGGGGGGAYSGGTCWGGDGGSGIVIIRNHR